MLEKLDSIDWANIHHSHGTAEQFPQWIRDLTSPDEKVWYKAWDNLREYSNHQDDLYDVTPYVVPFFTEILQVGGFPSCGKILELMGDYGSCSAWIVNEKALRAYDEMAITRMDIDGPAIFEFRKRNKLITQEVYQHLVDALPLFVKIITGENLELRKSAFQVLMTFQSHHEITIPLLANALDKHTIGFFLEQVSTFHLWDYRRTYGGFDNLWAVEYTKPERRLFVPPLLRLMHEYKKREYEITITLTMLVEEETPPEVLDVLCKSPGHQAAQALTTLKTDEALKRLREMLSKAKYSNIAHDVAYAMLEKVFTGLYREYAESQGPTIRGNYIWCGSELLDRSVETDMWQVTREPRRITFPKAETPLDMASVTREQRHVLQLIVDNDLFWKYPSNLLELYGLPAERSKVRALLAQEFK
ncbi:MAG: hypothetical protein K8L91_07500 [Anaerolineae bacterium]|nr:hypothetical protein [Anaerolineae bacterium]